MDHLVFDTRYTGDGFCFESAEFPQGNVMAALWMGRAPGVAHLVRSVCQTGAVAVLRSRRLWSTREEAERELARFDVVALRREADRLGAVLLSFMTSDRQGASADSVSALRSSSDR